MKMDWIVSSFAVCRYERYHSNGTKAKQLYSQTYFWKIVKSNLFIYLFFTTSTFTRLNRLNLQMIDVLMIISNMCPVEWHFLLSSLTQVSISRSICFSVIHRLFLPTLGLYLEPAAGCHHFPNLCAAPRSRTRDTHADPEWVKFSMKEFKPGTTIVRH